MVKVKADVSQIKPLTKEHFDRLNKINLDIATIDKVLEAADEAMDRNELDREKLSHKLDQNLEAVGKYQHLQLVKMVE